MEILFVVFVHHSANIIVSQSAISFAQMQLKDYATFLASTSVSFVFTTQIESLKSYEQMTV